MRGATTGPITSVTYRLGLISQACAAVPEVQEKPWFFHQHQREAREVAEFAPVVDNEAMADKVGQRRNPSARADRNPAQADQATDTQSNEDAAAAQKQAEARAADAKDADAKAAESAYQARAAEEEAANKALLGQTAAGLPAADGMASPEPTSRDERMSPGAVPEMPVGMPVAGDSDLGGFAVQGGRWPNSVERQLENVDLKEVNEALKAISQPD